MIYLIGGRYGRIGVVVGQPRRPRLCVVLVWLVLVLSVGRAGGCVVVVVVDFVGSSISREFTDEPREFKKCWRNSRLSCIDGQTNYTWHLAPKRTEAIEELLQCDACWRRKMMTMK